MTEGLCIYCKKIIISDLEKFLKESKEKYIQCPYCRKFMERDERGLIEIENGRYK